MKAEDTKVDDKKLEETKSKSFELDTKKQIDASEAPKDIASSTMEKTSVEAT